MSSRIIYMLVVDVDGQSLEWEYSDKDRAIAEARKYWQNGAFSARVYHYTNNGANCVDDYWQEQEVRA